MKSKQILIPAGVVLAAFLLVLFFWDSIFIWWRRNTATYQSNCNLTATHSLCRDFESKTSLCPHPGIVGEGPCPLHDRVGSCGNYDVVVRYYSVGPYAYTAGSALKACATGGFDYHPD